MMISIHRPTSAAWSFTVGLCVAASFAAGVGQPARADAGSYYSFQSPSGNIACTMIAENDGTGAAVCKLKARNWEVLARGSYCELAGHDVKMFEGNRPCFGIWPSQIFMLQDNGGLPTLGYGQIHTVGVITCASASSGVRCTDTGTGHYFDVSRDSYHLG